MSRAERTARRKAERAGKACACGDNFRGDMMTAPPGIQRGARAALSFVDAGPTWPPPAPLLLFAREQHDGRIVLAVGALDEMLPTLGGHAARMVRAAESERRRLSEHAVLYAVDAAGHRFCCVVTGDPARRVNVWSGERGQS